ncbi:DUF4352 domain-containing protein [Oenococcus sicerae]|uniref:DUF4352 domain-containing protein n=1 Tax=Oenococcus sicerae TaxID=2203724 RepID=A0AAJ1RBB5_9LACO|nr:DUF4352 domain-containing protein [Oenococcus sicerae]MDN6899652.1 DUF4352 domain-containing protein [Oenococcus sicerae]
MAIVLGTQAMYSKALDSASKSFSKATTTKVANSSKKTASESNTSSASSSSSENKIFNVGETIDVSDGLELKVTGVDYNSGSSMSTPDSGKTYVVVHVTLTNIGKDSLDYNPYYFKLSDNGNNTDLDEMSIMDDNGNDEISDVLNSGSLDQGASGTGSLVGQAVQTDKLQLVYVGVMDNGKVRVALN